MCSRVFSRCGQSAEKKVLAGPSVVGGGGVGGLTDWQRPTSTPKIPQKSNTRWVGIFSAKIRGKTPKNPPKRHFWPFFDPFFRSNLLRRAGPNLFQRTPPGGGGVHGPAGRWAGLLGGDGRKMVLAGWTPLGGWGLYVYCSFFCRHYVLKRIKKLHNISTKTSQLRWKK